MTHTKNTIFPNKMLTIAALLTVANLSLARAPQDLSHVHGIGFSNEGKSVLLGTHEGVFKLNKNGLSERISTNNDDYMSFIPHPRDANQYFGSGHPALGGNLGFVKSANAGQSWTKVSDGKQGPVDFHKLAISPSDESIIVGEHRGLQASFDGGISWKITGNLPQNVYSISLSTLSNRHIYAAGDQGLLISEDLGANWKSIPAQELPATVVSVQPNGKLFAFVVGEGLKTIQEGSNNWTLLNNTFGHHVPINLVWEPDNLNHLLIRDQTNALWESFDGGKTWAYFVEDQQLSSIEEKGQKLYENYCVQCHQPEGVGESYSEAWLKTKGYIAAPTMDYFGHAWHHSDEQLAETIKNGSPRTLKMPAWKDQLSDQQVFEIISYIKSLWTQRELNCQGPKHMSCM